MFIDYEKLVLADYDYKKMNNMLSLDMSDSTQARLKKECLRICSTPIQGKDEKIIREFCNNWNKELTVYQIIERYDVDKFKPLSIFLNRRKGSTNEKNIQLLAWLIDFPNRPFEHNRDYSSPTAIITENQSKESNSDMLNRPSPVSEAFPQKETDKPGSAENEQKEIFLTAGAPPNNMLSDPIPNSEVLDNDTELSPSAPKTVNTPRTKWRLQKLVLTTILLSLLGCGSCWWWGRTGSKGFISGPGGCMYWSVDHYQPISCDQKVPNTLVIALDMDKVKNFRKIMRPDTITNRGKGLVWYSKINNRVEFFTAEGNHPIFIDRHLKPATDYIITTYSHTGITAN